jgi:hypothetical protein
VKCEIVESKANRCGTVEEGGKRGGVELSRTSAPDILVVILNEQREEDEKG